MQHSNAQNARGESDRATNNAILNTMNSGIEMYKAVHAHDSFRNLDMVFNATYSKRYAHTTEYMS